MHFTLTPHATAAACTPARTHTATTACSHTACPHAPHTLAPHPHSHLHASTRTRTHTCTLAPALALALARGTGTRTCMPLPPLARSRHAATTAARMHLSCLHTPAPACPHWHQQTLARLHAAAQSCTQSSHHAPHCIRSTPPP